MIPAPATGSDHSAESGRARRRGFTLLELIVVLVVLGVLAALAAFGYSRFVDNSRAEGVRMTAAQVAKTVAAASATDRTTSATVASTSTPWAGDVDADTTVTAGTADTDGSVPVTVSRGGWCVVVTFADRVGDTGRAGDPATDGTCVAADGSTAAPSAGDGGTGGGTAGGAGVVSFDYATVTGAVYVYGTAIDAAGNTLVTGYFSNTAGFGTHTLANKGGIDVFVAKLAPDGTWLWAASAGGTDSDWAYDLALDSAGNAVVTGFYTGTGTFTNAADTAGLPPLNSASGTRDVFVAKIDGSTGNWTWVKSAGGSGGMDAGRGIAVDGSSGDVVVVGSYTGSATFTNDTGTSPDPLSGVGSDVFVAKVDGSTGEWVWASDAGGSGTDYGHGVALDSDGHAVVVGSYNDSATFGTLPPMSGVGSDVFVAKVDGSTGGWAWVSDAGGSGTDSGRGVTVDGTGNVVVVGSFSGSATFTNDTGTSPDPLSAANGVSTDQDAFVAKLDGPTGTWAWAKSGSHSAVTAFDVAVDAENHILVVGHYEYTDATYSKATFLNDNGTSHVLETFGNNIGAADVFVAKLTPDGYWEWAARRGYDNHDLGDAIAVDGGGRAVVGGRLNSNYAVVVVDGP